MIEAAIGGSFLLVALLVIRYLGRKSLPQRLIYALWLAAAIRLLIPGSFGVSAFSPMRLIPTAALNEKVYVLPVNFCPVEEASGVKVEDGKIVGDANSFGYRVLSGDGETITTYAAHPPLREVLGKVWFAGSLLLGACFVFQNLRTARTLKRHRVPLDTASRLPVYTVEDLPSPCLFGLLRPAIYLPAAAVNADTLPYMIAHEETHARHRDTWWALLRSVTVALHWWNPLVWFAAHCVRTDCELACDEAVIARLGEEKRFAYGRVLLSLVSARRAPLGVLDTATTMTGSGGSLRRRVQQIAQTHRLFWPVAVVSAVLVAATAVWAFQAASPAETLGAQLPDAAAVTSVLLQLHGANADVIQTELTDPVQIETLLTALQDAEKTAEQSIQDTPAEDSFYVIQLHGAFGSKTVYLYHRNNDAAKTFAEIPYTGIYRSDAAAMETIRTIYNEAEAAANTSPTAEQ